MKRRTLLQTLTVGAALLLLLTSCKGGSGTTEDTTGTGTTVQTEAATAIPRYDYMDAEVAPDVEIDRADYAGITLTIPNSYKIEDYTTQYNIMYGFGGFRIMDYNYTDAEWNAYVASQGGELNYK